MAGRPKRDVEVRGYLLRLTPALIDRLDLCCSILDVATGQRLPRNTRMQYALEEFCMRVEAEHQYINLAAPSIPSVPLPPLYPQPTLEPPQSQPTQPTPKILPTPTPTPRTRAQQREEQEAHIQRILSARETYDRLNLDEFARLLFDRDIYRATDRKTGEQKHINSGTLSRLLRQGGMS